MRLRRLDLTRYGRFTDAAIDLGPRAAGTPDLHILYGPNESGKSTAFSAWLDLLFGMRERHPYAFRHEWRRLRVAATLQDASGEHHLVRVGARGRDLFDAEDRPSDPLALQAMLHGLSRDSYRLMLSLDEESLRQGGEAILASEGDLGRMLFSAAAGLSHLSDRLAALRAEAAEFHAPGKRKSRLLALRDRLKTLKDEQAALDTRVAAYRRLTEAFEAAEAATATAREARDAAAAEALRFERLARGHQVAARLAVAEEALRAHRPAPPVPEGLRAEADALRLDHAARLTEKSLAEKAREDAERARAGLVRDADILALAEEVTALLQERPVVAKMVADRPKRQAELSEARVALEELCRAAGAADRSPEDVEIDPLTLGRLDDLSAAAAGLAAAAAAAAAERERAEEALGEAATDLERLGLTGDAALGPADPHGLAALRDRLRETAPAARLDGAAVVLERARADEAAALEALAPWQGDAPALARLAVPDTAQLAAWQAEAAEVAERAQARQGLLATLDAARRASEAAAEGAEAMRAAAKAAERTELRRLAPFSGDAAALAEQSPPRAEEVAAWVAAEDRTAKAVAVLTERRDQQAALAAEAVALRDGLADDPGLVTDDALAAARAARDTAWQAHLTTLSVGTAARFEAALAAHDALLERRLVGAERSARLTEATLRARAAAAAERATREALAAHEEAAAAEAAHRAPLLQALGLPGDWSATALAGWLDAREKALAALQRVGAERDRAVRSAEAAAAEQAAAAAALEAADGALAARRTALADAVRCAAVAAGLPSETPLHQLAAWCAQREAGLDQVAKRECAVADHRAAEAAVAQAVAEVTAALAEDGAEPAGKMPLQRLLERLQARVDWRAGRAQEARAALDARDAAAVEARRRREAAERAESAMAAWRADWAAALSGLWLEGDDADAFRVRLPALRDLPAARRHLAELRRRIARMDEDIEAHEASCRQIAGRLMVDAESSSAALAALEQRLAAARLAEDRYAALSTRIEAEAAARAEAVRALAAIDERAAALAVHVAAPKAIENPENLVAAIDAAEARARDAERVREAEEQLLEVLGVTDRAGANALLAEADADMLAQQRAAASARVAEAAALLEERLAARRDAERALEEVGGDARVAALATERQTALLEVETDARRALAAHIGALAAERAIALYRQRHRSAMLADSAAAFRTMTLGSFADLATQPDGKGGERLIALRAPGAAGEGPASVEVAGLTTGTRAQLYLALRVAAYARFCDAAGPLPFVADDILETFDDDRAAAALGLMAEMGESGQVLYFTHHQHLCTLAREALGDRVHIHPMPR